MASSRTPAIWQHMRLLRATLSKTPSRHKPYFLKDKSLSRSLKRQYASKQPAGTHLNPTPNLNSPEPHSLTARLRKLSREYGYTVIGVYLALTIADLPLCFLAVRYLGAERVAYAEDLVLGGAKNLVRRFFPNMFQEKTEQELAMEASNADEELSDNEGGEPTIWTQLGLAFVIHKSFIFVRVPLTAAITPKVVKTLRGWGYNIGKRTPKPK